MFPSCGEFWSWGFGSCEISNNQALIFEAIFALGLGFLFLWLQKRQSKKLEKVTKDVTEKIYSRNIKSYELELYFDDLEDTPEEQVKKRAKDWTEQIHNHIIVSSNGTSSSTTENNVEIDSIYSEKGFVEIRRNNPVRQGPFDGKMFRSVNVQLKINDFRLLDEIIKFTQKRPYILLRWNIEGKYDISQIISQIEEKTGRKPGSMKNTYSADGAWDAAMYNLAEVDGVNMVTQIATDSIYIHYWRKCNLTGFYRAHEMFNPGKIISMLFGEVKMPEIRELMKASLQP